MSYTSAKKLTQTRLKELLDYNPNTGIFTWKINIGIKIKAGDITGYSNNGYQVINIDHKSYYAHRLAWLYVYGYFPENQIDHIDRVKYHNWIKNLREVSPQCNVRNTGNYCTNTSGVKGVSWGKKSNKWHVQIRVNYKVNCIGYYKDFDEAVCARLATEQCLDWSGCDNNSPAYQYVKNNIQKGAN